MSDSENPQIAAVDSRAKNASDAARLYRRLPAVRWSVRARLLAIVVALVLPLNLMVFVVIANLVRAADASQRASLLYSARSVAAGVDAELGKYLALGLALSRSPTLLDGRMAEFETEAKRAFVSVPEAWIVLSNPEGQQVINTTIANGAPLPVRQTTAIADQTRAFDTGSPVISGVYIGPARRDAIVAVNIPVFKDGRPFRSLAVIIPARRFLSLFNVEEMPRKWLAGIIDSQGRYIARVPDQDEVAGKLASEGWRASMKDDGVSEFLSRTGDPVVNANAHPRLAQWTIGIAAQKSELDTIAARAVAWATASGAAISVVSLLLALAMARRITQPIARLRDAAEAVMFDSSAHFESDLPEFEAFWASLKRAAVERARNERMVRDSERRLRLASVAAHFGAYEFNPLTGFAILSPEAYSVLGIAPDTPVREAAALVAALPQDRARVADEVAVIHRRIGPYEVECRVLRSDGAVRWILDRGEALAPIDAKTGFVSRTTGVLLDITERKSAEERTVLLMREVSHRAKNMLSVVQAIARRTAASSGPEFVERFEQRIQALAANQDLLIENDWRGIAAADLVRAQLLHFADLIGRRIAISGPDLRLTPEAAQGIGMALHELTTNAAKYGALSSEGGSLDISWRIDGGDFEIAWTESSGPPVVPPTRQGFGAVVVTQLARASVSGTVTLDYATSGLVWKLRCPAENAVEIHPAA